ncbi:unnamed protein product [Malus baccata var. baccata]
MFHKDDFFQMWKCYSTTYNRLEKERSSNTYPRPRNVVSVAVIEGLTKLTTGKLISLSKQELHHEGGQPCIQDNWPRMWLQSANSEAALLKAVTNQQFLLPFMLVVPTFCCTQVVFLQELVEQTSIMRLPLLVVELNSWGAECDEEGYIRMQRDVETKGGLYGIAGEASYPTP